MRPILINNRYPSLSYTIRKIYQMFKELDNSGLYEIPEGELSIVFVDDPTLIRLHKTYLNDPTPTDVMTFPGDPIMDFAGEIVASVDHAITASQEQEWPLAKELTLYLVHGWLHLSGLKDKTKEQQKKMREAEITLLDHLEKIKAIPDFSIIQPAKKLNLDNAVSA